MQDHIPLHQHVMLVAIISYATAGLYIEYPERSKSVLYARGPRYSNSQKPTKNAVTRLNCPSYAQDFPITVLT